MSELNETCPLDIECGKMQTTYPKKDDVTVTRDLIKLLVKALKNVTRENAHCTQVSLTDIRGAWEFPLTFTSEKSLISQLRSYALEALESTKKDENDNFHPRDVVITHTI